MATFSNSGAPSDRRMIELDPAMSMHLLGSVGYGRLVFTSRAMPAIRPVNHILDTGRIVICTSVPTRTTPPPAGVHMPNGTVVAYEADQIDPVHRIGWSVVVTGMATLITDQQRLAHLLQLLAIWVQRADGVVLGIQPSLVTGFQLTKPARSHSYPWRGYGSMTSAMGRRG